jgi:hypothetical protein
MVVAQTSPEVLDTPVTKRGKLKKPKARANQYVQMLRDALNAGPDDGTRAQRVTIGLQMEVMALTLDKRLSHAVSNRDFWGVLSRLAKAAASAASAGTGGALIAHLKGPAGTTLGTIALALGVLGGVGTAINADQVYGVERDKTVLYEKLLGDVWDYALLKLPKVPVSEAEAELAGYRLRYARIRDMGSLTPASVFNQLVGAPPNAPRNAPAPDALHQAPAPGAVHQAEAGGPQAEAGGQV